MLLVINLKFVFIVFASRVCVISGHEKTDDDDEKEEWKSVLYVISKRSRYM